MIVIWIQFIRVRLDDKVSFCDLRLDDVNDRQFILW